MKFDIELNYVFLYYGYQKLKKVNEYICTLANLFNNLNIVNNEIPSTLELKWIRLTFHSLTNYTLKNLDSRIQLIKNLLEDYCEDVSLFLLNEKDMLSQEDKFDVVYQKYMSNKYITNLDLLLAKYAVTYDDVSENSDLHVLKQLNKNSSLYDYYPQDYIDFLMDFVTENYSGRSASVNAVLVLLQLAADNGVKINYEHNGTSSSISQTQTYQVVNGADCNAFVSWAINLGSKEPFNWMSVGSFSNAGEKIDYENWENALPGDIFVRNPDSTRSDDHVGIIIDNRPETGEFVVAEARGTNYGIVLRTVGYNEMKNTGFKVRDMSSYYGDIPQLTVGDTITL